MQTSIHMLHIGNTATVDALVTPRQGAKASAVMVLTN